MPKPTIMSTNTDSGLRRMLLTAVCLLGLFTASSAQMIDKIVAIVGEDVVLLSDVENQYAYFLANGQKDDGTLRCCLFLYPTLPAIGALVFVHNIVDNSILHMWRNTS